MSRRASDCFEAFDMAAAGSALARLALMIAAFVALLVGTAAWPAPPEGADPALAPWFQSLQTRNGGSCCSMADCLPRSYRTAGDHYEVFAGKDDAGAELWLPVPADAVLERYDNPTGRAVACVWQGRVLCFVKGLVK